MPAKRNKEKAEKAPAFGVSFFELSAPTSTTIKETKHVSNIRGVHLKGPVLVRTVPMISCH
jgi:hypothetical protein